MKRTLSNLSLWFVLVLIVANGLAWAGALAPDASAAFAEPRVAPCIADLMQIVGHAFRVTQWFQCEQCVTLQA